MKIGFDVSQTGRSKAGCGYFADSLIRELALVDARNEYFLYRTFGDSFWDANHIETCTIERSNFRSALQHGTLEAAQQFWRCPPEDIENELDTPDIVHANNFFCPAGMPHAKLVYTLYDLSFLNYPEWTTEQNRITCLNGVFNASLHADFIVAISEYSLQHFLDTFPHYPVERTQVIYPASRFSLQAHCAQPKRFTDLLQDGFWLNVGTLEPRKNHHRLLEAYALLKARQADVLPLVLAGGKGWVLEDFEKTLDDLGIRENVIMLGYVDDDELQWLYQNCFALVYPSLFEGFGLPVLEAMTLGAPVITSRVSSIPEIVGDAGILIDPLQSQEIFQAMLKLGEQPELRAALRVRAIAQARQFSWAHAAQSVLRVYAKLVKATPKHVPAGSVAMADLS